MKSDLFSALLKSIQQMDGILRGDCKPSRETHISADHETEYLLASPRNAKRLRESVSRINNSKQGA